MKRTVSLLPLGCVLLAFGCGDVSSPEHGAEEPSSAASSLDAPQTFQNGVALTGLSGTRGQERVFSLLVPSDATRLHFAISGGTGDADIYVRFGAAPTRTTYDYRPYLNGNDESVDPTPIRAGTYFVLLRGYTAYAGLSLVASFDATNTGTAGASGAGGSGTAGSSGAPAAGAAGNGGASNGPDCTQPSTWPAAWVSYENQTLDLINARRAAGATCGTTVMLPVAAIAMESHLLQAARCHSLDMGLHAYFDHNSQDGRSPWDRIAQAGYTNAAWQGENIAAGYTTPSAVVDGWMNSPGHCSNIMSANFKDTGLGYALVSGSPYQSYWTQDFAKH